MTATQKVLAFTRKYGLFDGCTGCVLGVSGGPDSVAMLHILSQNKGAFPFPLCVAHVNHGLRPEADGEEEAVKHLCHTLGVPFFSTKADVAATCPKGVGLETYAREVRYRFFESVRVKMGFSHVATAHTADDDVETFFLHLCRGSGTTGLQGIRPLRDGVVAHPVLCLEKRELLSYCDANRLSYALDRSNNDPICARNVLRNDILPRLKELNPSLSDALRRTAQTLGEDDACLEKMADRLYRRVRTDLGLDAKKLQKSDAALVSRVFRRAFAAVCPTALSYVHVQALKQLVYEGNDTDVCHLPDGWRAKRAGDEVVFCRETGDTPTFEPFALTEGTFDVGAFVLTVTHTDKNAFLSDSALPCTVRPRRADDRVCLSRAAGTKTLKKLFNEKKIPRGVRLSVPVISDENGVLCVVGVGKDVRTPAGGSGFIFTLTKK